MNEYQRFFKNYTCAKCRGRSCTTTEASIKGVSKSFILRGTEQEFLLVTCTLCGYTEMYNLRVLVAQREEALVKEPKPVINESG